MIDPGIIDRLRALVGAAYVRTDEASRLEYGADALKRGRPADVVVLPADTAEVSAVARLCSETGTPLVPRGAGTGYSGGAVPAHGGVVLSLERLDRILEIDEASLLVVTQPCVITGDLQDAVEARGLFYPPDPASLRRSSIGGNVAECAGGPRAFKYGVTRHYVLGLEAVLMNGDIIRTGGRVVKNVVGYDLTQLLVGSEGTLAIITAITLRLIPKPLTVTTLRATFATVRAAVDAVAKLVAARVVPSTMEIVDRSTLEAVAASIGDHTLAPAGTGAMLILEVDGLPEQVEAEARRVADACREAQALEVLRADDEAERERLWRVRRGISHALVGVADLKINNDIVVPKGRVPECFDLVERLKAKYGLPIPSFGHVGDGNIHVNIMVTAGDPEAVTRARAAEAELFEGVVALGGAISGEHGIGLTKAPYLGLGVEPATIALMQRVKAAFDPAGLLNPGKIFPQDVVPLRADVLRIPEASASGNNTTSGCYDRPMPVIAVVGASRDRQKFGNRAVRAFREQGYTVVPINPRETEIEGERTWPSVLAYPGPIDEATIYVPEAAALRVVDELAAKGIRRVWFNPGADAPAVVARAREIGLEPVVACSIMALGE